MKFITRKSQELQCSYEPPHDTRHLVGFVVLRLTFSIQVLHIIYTDSQGLLKTVTFAVAGAKLPFYE